MNLTEEERARIQDEADEQSALSALFQRQRLAQRPHGCKEYIGCICTPHGLEPNDKCPRHGHPWPPRCVCGRFVKREN